MRYALFSDVHANLPALDAVLADIRQQDALHGVYHLGDLVGYAPWPDEVVDTIAGQAISGVGGNYDSTVATAYKHCGCQYEDARQQALAHESYTWTLAHTSPRAKAFLGSLPFRMDIRPFGGHEAGPTVRLFHGNQTLNTVYVTADRSDEFLKGMAASLGARAGDVVCFGHTHLAWQRTVDGIHFVNTGSVGRPRDGDPRAGYVLLDVTRENISAEFRRVSYDVEKTAAAIRASELPDEFAHYLETGGSLPPV